MDKGSLSHEARVDQKELKKKKKKKRSRKSFSDLVNEIVEDSDSGSMPRAVIGTILTSSRLGMHPHPKMRKAYSRPPRFSQKMSTGPVKSSHRKVPLAKLQGHIEDLFEADDSLPDRDSLQDLLPGRASRPLLINFFELIEAPSSTGADSRSSLS